MDKPMAIGKAYTREIEMLKEAETVAAIARDTFGYELVAVSLYGSFVSGGLRPQSDVDLIVVIDRPMTPAARKSLAASLLEVSSHYPNRPGEPRCIELSVMLKSELAAPAYPARSEFLYGEWLRDAFETGIVPEPFSDPGVTLMLAQARQESVPVVGPDLATLLAEIPADQVRRAMGAALPSLVESLAGDERNVLLTLARMWRTAETGEFVPKDAAVNWAAPRLPSDIAHILQYASDAYLGIVADNWTSRAAEAQQASDYLHQKVLALL